MAPTGFPGIDDWPHRSPQPLKKCFVLTRILPPKTSQEVTHPRTTPSQAHLTWKFLQMSYRKGWCTFGGISSHHFPFKPFFPISMSSEPVFPSSTGSLILGSDVIRP